VRPAILVVAAMLSLVLPSRAAAQRRQASRIAPAVARDSATPPALVRAPALRADGAPTAARGPALLSAIAPVVSRHAVPMRDGARRASPWAIAASAVLPGAGQALLGQKRSIAYGVIVGLLVMRYIGDRRDGNRSRDRYRFIAHDVARAPFAEDRPTGSCDYYERMSKSEASGAFDAIPGGSLDPETDPSTYNGAMWQLSRETFWLDPQSPPPVDSPEYQRAIQLYRARAYDDAYRWSWEGATTEQDQFRRAIRRANREYRHAATDLGFLIANHVLSSIDAFVEARVRRREGPAGATEVSATIPLDLTRGLHLGPPWRRASRDAP
jgi:hypothetical protein